MSQNPVVASTVATVLDYHEATRHRLDGYAPGPGFLDWDSQPDPFRRWADAPAFELPLVAGTERVSYDELYRPQAAEPMALDERSLGLFLELALGLSAWKRHGPDRWALRNNPSSGNLHPTEGYVLLWRRVSDAIQPGLYHYAPYEHALERRARLPDPQARVLALAHPSTFGAIAFSSIVWREEWKYGARAYRYCQLDVGHALGAARYAAATLGWDLRVDAGADDRWLADLLGLDRREDYADAEPEHPELLALFGAGALTAPDWPALASSWCDWQGRAGRISADRVQWPQIARVLPAAARSGHAPVRAWSAPVRPVLPPACAPCDAATLIRSRRSAQRMDTKTGIEDRAFYRALARTLPARDTVPFDAFPHAPSINLVIFVHDVAGLAPGLYALLRDAQPGRPFLQALRADPPFECAEMECAGLPLYRLRAPQDLRRVASGLSCHQGIAGRGAFAVAMLADVGRVLEAEGAWAWRRIHWEAGLIGQSLYLEAEAAGLRGTGIGCFFDDEVLGFLGLVKGARAFWQVIYHFTVGQAVEDKRLVSEPAYAHLEPGRSAGVSS